MQMQTDPPEMFMDSIFRHLHEATSSLYAVHVYTAAELQFSIVTWMARALLGNLPMNTPRYTNATMEQSYATCFYATAR
jgi:hypothetical protein